MPPLELRDAYSELDRQLWKIERERCLEALAAGRSARPYLERRLARIDRALRALHVLLELQQERRSTRGEGGCGGA